MAGRAADHLSRLVPAAIPPYLEAHDRLLPPRNRFRTRSLHRRADRRQARGVDRAAQPLAAPAAHRIAARGGAAEEYPDDRADRRRQDRDRAAAGQARRRAVHQGRGDEIHRGRLCRPRRRADHPRPGRGRDRPDPRAQAQGRARRAPSSPPRSACWTRWSGAGSSAATRDSFRRKLRAGELNDKEIEIETQASGGMPMFEIPGMPGAQMGAISIGDIFGKMGARTKTRRADGRGFARTARQRGIRQAARQRPIGAGSDQCGREQRHRVPRRDRQDLRAATAAAAAMSRAKACSATCCR